MKFVVATSNKRKLDEVSQLLSGRSNLELRDGSVPDVSHGCDAAVMHFTLAHDRYGGRPVVGQSQVLRNSRNDGVAPIILATPPLEAGAGLGPDKDAETERHTARMVGMALDAWVKSPDYPEDASGLVCLIHIEGAGLTFSPLDAICRGLEKTMGTYG